MNPTPLPPIIQPVHMMAGFLNPTENSTKGGTKDSTSTTVNLGDQVGDKQYRAVLSFLIPGPLPNNAVITKVTIKDQKADAGGDKSLHHPRRFEGGHPHAVLRRDPSIGDHRFPGSGRRSRNNHLWRDTVNNWYDAVIGPAGYPYINKLGPPSSACAFTRMTMTMVPRIT